ncbi:MAG: bacillithiol system redox-active protein YtxJ [Gemmatimonadaceae bacterium]
MKHLVTRTDLDALFAAEQALVFKNSRTCPISAAARRQVAALIGRHPDLQIFVVDVHSGAPLSREIERRTGIVHHSPQVIVLACGAPRWHASHFDITARDVERALEPEESV